MPTRILLVDDHAVLRSGLRLLLDAQADLNVVGEAGDGHDAVTLARGLQPDLVLLDLNMPGGSGMAALTEIRKVAPTARVLILTMHDDEGYLRQALRSGASGYVLKKAADSELLSAIRAVMRGEVYVHASLTRALLDDLVADGGRAQPSSGTDLWIALSEREYEVLKGVARGHTNAEIAQRLSLSVKTVETYRARGMEKLGLRTRAQLFQAALAKGLLD